MPGTVPRNLHEGSRSEVLADYLFSAWGPVNPIRHQSDSGVDLYCALWEGEGSLRRVLHYYTVQIKSIDEPWTFKSDVEVKWLVEHPTPLFLGIVDKSTCTMSLYHLTPRFAIWTSTNLPTRFALIPGKGTKGKWLNWKAKARSSLSAPIMKVSMPDLMDPERMEYLRKVFQAWLDIDRNNCDLIRRRILRYRMPKTYTTNEVPHNLVEAGSLPSAFNAIEPGVRHLLETLECSGHQLGAQGDLMSSVYAATLLDHILDRYQRELQVRASSRSTNFFRFIEAELRQLKLTGHPSEATLGDAVAAVRKAIEGLPLLKPLLSGR